ncbi:hypothetical protein KC734_16855 [candidate division KSB1 bacterium]|nr:hypothetical protein [candidate division KSB1 bacterium]
MMNSAQSVYLRLFLFFVLITAVPLLAQPPKLEDMGNDAPRVFLDCNRCDRGFLNQDVTFVNFVRDRNDAQVHVLVTVQRTGSDGWEYTLDFMGQHEFDGMNDRLKYFSVSSDSDDEIRHGFSRMLKIGLMRFIAQTPLAQSIVISQKYTSKRAPSKVTDKWKNWLFRVSLRTYFQGQQSTNELFLGGAFSANRITDNWKIRLSMNGDYKEDVFDTGDEEITDISRRYRWNSVMVKSLGQHWSAGGYTRIFSSTYDNKDIEVFVSPAIEYNLLPYSESTRRELRFLYRVGPSYVKYGAPTIFDKSNETLIEEELSVNYETKQPWGTVEMELEGSHYFHDLSKHRVRLVGEFVLRVFRGLSLDFVGSVTRIRDQLALPMGGASAEEILLRRRELATSYRYNGSLRLSYTFGSIYSNVVNPRFGG